MSKRSFDVNQALARIEETVGPFPQAAMFELADEGFDSPFELLAACIISILPGARHVPSGGVTKHR